MTKILTYKKSGVNIDVADKFVHAIKPLIKTTKRPEAVGGIGGFSGLFKPNFKNLRTPMLVSSTDGVGTKLMVANILKKYDTVGIDLVAMCVNDIITCGAEPLFFLDYFATNRILHGKAVSVVKGIVKGCREAGCALLGGETAEMPGLYPKGEFDLAGFCVGIIDKSKIIDGKSISPGDVVLGIQSSGLHSNGFSLVRRLFTKSEMAGTFLKKELLKPTIIYVKPVLSVLKKTNIKGIVNITGGGFYDNIPRILPKDVSVRIDKRSWRRPAIFGLIQKEGRVAEKEMYRTFNMGIGMVLVAGKKDADKTKTILARHKLQSWIIGEVAKGKKEVIL